MNYINPLIGDVAIQDITPRFVDQFYKRLEKTPPVSSRNRKPKDEFLPPQTREKIYKLLKCAFKQAVRNCFKPWLDYWKCRKRERSEDKDHAKKLLARRPLLLANR